MLSNITIQNETGLSEDKLQEIIKGLQEAWPRWDSIHIYSRFKEGKEAVSTFVSVPKSKDE